MSLYLSLRQETDYTIQLGWLYVCPNRITQNIVDESHTRTVVRECCNGDDASQWENGKFDPLPRPNPLTDRHIYTP